MKNSVRLWIAFTICSILGIFALYFESTLLARPTYEEMIAKATNSVVKIEVSKYTANKESTVIDDVFTSLLAKHNRPDLPRSTHKDGDTGSGFIVDKKGVIVTNNHVVEGGDEITVILNNNKSYPAHIIATDKDTDLAALQIDGTLPDLNPIVFGNSDDLVVGESISVIGSPLALEQTVTRGIVSALNRSAPNFNSPYNYYIQTDAAINPGNSGGPMINNRGQVVGISDFIISPTNASIGLGFGITSNFAKFVVTELVNDKKFKRNYIGAGIKSVDKTVLEILGEPLDTTGVYVSETVATSPNAKIIKAGDIIVEIEGKPISESRDVIRIVTLHNVNEPLNVTVLRNNASLKLQLKVYNQ